MEIWDAYYADFTKAGFDLVRGEPIPDGLRHLVCEVLVRHVDGSYLLMRRDPNKPGYGGMWEATAGGSAIKGEDPLTCIRRELLEETGITGTDFTEIGRTAAMDAHTIYVCYLCTTDCAKDTVTLQEGETVAYRWLDEDAFIAFIHSGDMIDRQKDRMTPYFTQMGYMER